MRVVHVVESLSSEFGGLSKAVLDTAITMAEFGHDVEVVTTDARGVQPQFRVVISSFSQDFGSWPLLKKAGVSGALDRHLRTTIARSDVVHVHGLWRMFNVYAGRAAYAAHVPVVVSPHGMLSQQALQVSAFSKRILWWGFQKTLLQLADAIHVTSKEEALDVVRLGVSTEVHVVPHGIPTPGRLHAPAYKRRKVILFLGRLHPIKNLETLLEAWRSAVTDGPEDDWELVIAGAGDARYTAQLIQQASGDNSVRFVGSVEGEAKRRVLAEAAALVLPSVSENFGLVVLEALSAETPVVCSTGTPWSGVVDSGCGSWVEPSVQALGSALRSFIDLPCKERRAMGVRGRQWVRTKFDLHRNVANLMSLYEEITQALQG